MTQFSVPLGSDAHVTAWVDALADEHGRLLAAIEAPPPAQLQAQLLLLRVCASPRANYWLPALPLVWGARLAGAVDRDARRLVLAALRDSRDSAATRTAVVGRAALPPKMGGLGIGGRALVLPAAALAFWVDALRAGAAYSPDLAAIRADLLRSPVAAEDGSVVLPPPPGAGASARLAAPRPAACRPGGVTGGVTKRRSAAATSGRRRRGRASQRRHLFDPSRRSPPRPAARTPSNPPLPRQATAAATPTGGAGASAPAAPECPAGVTPSCRRCPARALVGVGPRRGGGGV